MQQQIRLLALAFAVVILVLSGLVIVSAGAAGAPVDSDNETTTQSDETERIDSNTKILNSSYNEQTGRATVVIESDTFQRITVSDAGVFMTGGTVEQRTVSIEPGDTARISLPVTEVEDRVGVSIATNQKLYGHLIEVPNYLFYSDPGWSTVRIVGFASGFGVLLAVGSETARRRWFQRNEVRRIA